MARQEQSSGISASSYDDKTGDLLISFVKGGTWKYNVPAQVYSAFRNAASKGVIFNVMIRP
jgi:hypothetical protein